MPELTVIVPVYNEDISLPMSIERLMNVDLDMEVLIVDDGSTDETPTQIKRLMQRFPAIKALRHRKNMGKGAAIRTALKKASGELVVVHDADMEYDPVELKLLIEPIRKNRADVVFGSRFLGAHRVFLFWHHIGNKFLSLLANVLYNTNLTDLMTGYKMMRLEHLKSFDLRSNGFEIEAEITAKVFRSKLRVYEIPISYEGRTWVEGKKTYWFDGVRVFLTLIKFRLWVLSVGEETLNRISKMRKFNWWLFNKFSHHLGDRVLEAGCGTGTLSYYLRNKPLVVCLDYEQHYVERLAREYQHYPNMKFYQTDLNKIDVEPPPENQFDSIICVNVLEHIEHHGRALDGFFKLLKPGGKLMLYVPAHPFLHCEMDDHLGHFRRYTPSLMKELASKHGFEAALVEYANLFGWFGWFLNGKILHKKILGSSQLSFYESLTPIFQFIERSIEKSVGLPFGLSLNAVLVKPPK